jgi:hypothetical protein
MAFLPFVPQLALGAIQTGVALNELNKLRNQPLPRYDFSPTQANVSMYRQRLAQGLPPAEIAAMQQAQASQNAGGYRQATELSGGQLSSAIGRIGQLQNINLATRMGQMQAQERRAAQSGLAASQSALQGRMNMQTQYDMQRRAQEEQALGGAMKAGLQSMGNALTYGAFDYLGGLNKTSGTSEISTVTQQSAANVTPALPTGTPLQMAPGFTPSYMQTPAYWTNMYGPTKQADVYSPQGGLLTPPLPTGTPLF